MNNTVLEVRNLSLNFHSYLGIARVLDNVNFSVKQGELFGIAGESGCGKSVTTYSIMKLLPHSASIESGQILFNDRDLLGLSEKELQGIRGKEISIVFQDPNASLNPSLRIERQIRENYQIHSNISKREARQKAITLLEQLKITYPERRLRQYPHELSGGIKQRICFAMALIFHPKILIADEFTTNLDVTMQAEMIKILNELRSSINTSVLFISHDLSLIYQCCDSAAIMYAGQIVEKGRVKDLFKNPLHPYTQGLLEAVPVISKDAKRLKGIDGFVPNLVNAPPGCRFGPRCKGFLKDVCDVSFPQPYADNDAHHVFCHLYEGR